MLLLNCAVCGNTKSRLIQEQKCSRLLSRLGIKTILSKIPLVGPVLLYRSKINENKFLFTGDKFMHKIHLRQPGFTYNAWRPFTRTKEQAEKFKDTGDSKNTYLFVYELYNYTIHEQNKGYTLAKYINISVPGIKEVKMIQCFKNYYGLIKRGNNSFHS